MDLGARIKQLRLEKHLSQEALAGELEISRQAVAKWEDNSSKPSTANLLALCGVFGISLEELVSGQAEPKAAAKAGRRSKAKGALLAGSAVLLAASVAAAAESVREQPLRNAIGYADAATGIFIAGTPVWVYLLYGLTAVLLVVTAGFFIWPHKKKPGKGR